jgi:hypothetical protein
MEALCRMIVATIDIGFLLGLSVGSGLSKIVNVFHLLFVDDTLVFCGAISDQLRFLEAYVIRMF